MALGDFLNHLQPLAQILSQVPVERLLGRGKSPEPTNTSETEKHPPKSGVLERPVKESLPPTREQSIQQGTACTLCSDEHLNEVSGALSEALRFARNEGLESKEAVRRVRHARDELNAMERFDLAPEEVTRLPEDEKEVAQWVLPESRNLRHMINGIRSVDDLEAAAAKAAETADAFVQKLMTCKPSYFETKQEPAKELPPEIQALKAMVEERKGAGA